jgi:8-oxo-dGTP pyrophosphatase MutT (NUDIX family)
MYSDEIRNRIEAIVRKDNKILLCEDYFKNKRYFVFPGGGIDNNESKEDAAKRETLEEAGVLVKNIRLLNYSHSFTNKNASSKISKRIASKQFKSIKTYYCICDFDKYDNSLLGKAGDAMKIFFLLPSSVKLEISNDDSEYAKGRLIALNEALGI